MERRTAGRPTSRDPAGCLLLGGRQLLESTKRLEGFTKSTVFIVSSNFTDFWPYLAN